MKTKKKILVSLLTCFALAFTAFGVGNFTTVNRASALANDETVQNIVNEWFTPVGDNGLDAYVNDIYYGAFTNTKFSGAGVMVETRNKAEDLVNNTDLSNDINPPLIDFPSVKYSAGVKFNGVVDISDNTASDTLIELAFPGTNDNWQNRGFKVIIEDALNPNNYIALFVWGSYSNWDATGGGVIAAAAGTWEKTNHTSDDVYIGETGFDTNNYNGNAIFSIVGSDLHDGAIGGTGKPNDGCFLNSAEYGHTKTSVNFSRTSENSIKVQFDNENGTLSINGVHIRDFKNFSADDEHYFPGFTDNKVKLSVSIMRTTKRSTDEFTRFCIMGIDDFDQVVGLPKSGLIASGNTDIPAPVSFSFANGETAPIGFSVNITDPDGATTENYDGTTFDFDKAGAYYVEYFVEGASKGTVKFNTAIKTDDKLVEVASFKVSDDLYYGKKITLADFILTTDDVVAIESATVKIYEDDNLIATETADADWEYALDRVGELTFVVSNDDFTLKTSATVLAALYPSAPITNGSVDIAGKGDTVGLTDEQVLFVITPDKGYTLKSLKVDGVDVSNEVVNGMYLLDVEDASKNIAYEVEFEKLPDVSITFKADGVTISTVSDLSNGTLFSEVNKPTIPVKEHYNIFGWDIADDTAITTDIVVNAVYTNKKYTITFDTDGGSEIAPKQFDSLTAITATELDAVPEKTGLVFDAWYLGTEKFVLGTELTSDITLTAHYNIKKLNITVKSADFDDVVLTIDYDTAVSAAQFSEKAGYEFKGLFTDEQLTKAYNGEKLTEDTVLYASYEKKSGCGGNILGSGAELIILATLLAAVCISIINKKSTNKN